MPEIVVRHLHLGKAGLDKTGLDKARPDKLPRQKWVRGNPLHSS